MIYNGKLCRDVIRNIGLCFSDKLRGIESLFGCLVWFFLGSIFFFCIWGRIILERGFLENEVIFLNCMFCFEKYDF